MVNENVENEEKRRLRAEEREENRRLRAEEFERNMLSLIGVDKAIMANLREIMKSYDCEELLDRFDRSTTKTFDASPRKRVLPFSHEFLDELDSDDFVVPKDQLSQGSNPESFESAPNPIQGAGKLSDKEHSFLQMDTSISHVNRAPEMTICSEELFDSHSDSRSMTQTFVASPEKPKLSDDSDSDDLHIVGGTKEIPSEDQSATGEPPSSTLLIASCDLASQTDHSHFD
ncbi:MAG: hypothetical protein GY696_26235, partial [Gammaproteobacteria bacterium]|nr:hypothetical protein [Gammaproteobacteria bacterium]